MSPFRRRSRSRGRTPRRPKEWLGYASTVAATGAPVGSIVMTPGSVYGNYILSPDEMTTLYDEPTFIRGLLRHTLAWNLVPNAGTTVFFGYGLIALKIEAAGGVLPAASLPFLPLPYFDADSDWIYETHYNIVSDGSTQIGAVYGILNALGEVDIKTKRRFPNGYGLALIAYYDSSQAGLNARLSVTGRVLLANH